MTEPETVIHLAVRESLTTVHVQPPTGTIEHTRSHRTAAPPPHVARLLGDQSDTPMVERTTVLTINGEPTLTSTSYLPTTLTHGTCTDDGQQWRAVEPGQLALPCHTVTIAKVEHWTRPPTPAECGALAITSDTPVVMFNQLCHVRIGGLVVLAAVILIARSDRVSTRWDAPMTFVHHNGDNGTAAPSPADTSAPHHVAPGTGGTD